RSEKHSGIRNGRKIAEPAMHAANLASQSLSQVDGITAPEMPVRAPSQALLELSAVTAAEKPGSLIVSLLSCSLSGNLLISISLQSISHSLPKSEFISWQVTPYTHSPALW